MKRVVFLAFVSVFLLVFMHGRELVMTASSSTAHHVYPGQSIQETINSAQSGDTVFACMHAIVEPDLNEDSLSLLFKQPGTQETVELFLVIIGVFILVASIYFLYEHAYPKGTKFKKKKFFLSVFLAAILVIAAVIFAWIFSYHWSFSVITNKPSYELGEDVYITVVLENVGYVPLSFKSVATNPIIVNILDARGRSVGFFPSNFDYTGIQFTIPPHQSLERTFAWNQADRDSEEQVEPGKYIILAYIYGESWRMSLFQTHLAINITSN